MNQQRMVPSFVGVCKPFWYSLLSCEYIMEYTVTIRVVGPHCGLHNHTFHEGECDGTMSETIKLHLDVGQYRLIASLRNVQRPLLFCPLHAQVEMPSLCHHGIHSQTQSLSQSDDAMCGATNTLSSHTVMVFR